MMYVQLLRIKFRDLVDCQPGVTGEDFAGEVLLGDKLLHVLCGRKLFHIVHSSRDARQEVLAP